MQALESVILYPISLQAPLRLAVQTLAASAPQWERSSLGCAHCGSTQSLCRTEAFAAAVLHTH